MSTTKKTLILSIFYIALLSSVQNVVAQMDAQYSAKMFTQQLVNPATVGETDLANVYAGIRNQWKSVGPTTMSAFFDTPIQGVKRMHGAGFSVVDDEAGLFNNVTVNFAYSHKQNLWGGRLSVGAQGGFLQFKFNGDEVETLPSSDYHNQLGSAYANISTEASEIKFDMALGLHYVKDDYFFGASLTHLTSPTLELEDAGASIYFNKTLNLYGGYDFTLRSVPELLFKSSFYMLSDFKLTQFDINCNAWYKNSIFAGLSYRFQDAVVVMAGMQLKNGILVGGAYDMTTSNMAYGGFGTTEIFLKYEFSLSLNSKSNKYKSIRIL